MSPPPVLTIEDRQCFPFRQVFWLWDDPTPDPFPSSRTVVLAGFASHHSGGSAPELHGIPFSIPTSCRDHLSGFFVERVIYTSAAGRKQLKNNC